MNTHTNYVINNKKIKFKYIHLLHTIIYIYIYSKNISILNFLFIFFFLQKATSYRSKYLYIICVNRTLFKMCSVYVLN